MNLKHEYQQGVLADLYNNFFEEKPDNDSPSYVTGASGSITNNDGYITILDRKDDYIVRNLPIGKLKLICEFLK